MMNGQSKTSQESGAQREVEGLADALLPLLEEVTREPWSEVAEESPALRCKRRGFYRVLYHEEIPLWTSRPVWVPIALYVVTATFTLSFKRVGEEARLDLWGGPPGAPRDLLTHEPFLRELRLHFQGENAYAKGHVDTLLEQDPYRRLLQERLLSLLQE